MTTTKGKLVSLSLDQSEDNELSLHTKGVKEVELDGEVFSSPIVFDNEVYLGCRDNYLYSFTF